MNLKIKVEREINDLHLGYEILKDGSEWCVLTKNNEETISNSIFSSMKHGKLRRRVFTGLYNKNEEEIYDGDILGGGTNVEPFEVIFEDGCFRSRFEGNEIQRAILTQDRVRHLETLGDRFKNPELIR